MRGWSRTTPLRPSPSLCFRLGPLCKGRSLLHGGSGTGGCIGGAFWSFTERATGAADGPFCRLTLLILHRKLRLFGPKFRIEKMDVSRYLYIFVNGFFSFGWSQTVIRLVSGLLWIVSDKEPRVSREKERD